MLCRNHNPREFAASKSQQATNSNSQPVNHKRYEYSVSTVSIIIPVLNEEKMLPLIFRQLRQLCPAPDELILVDGGSTDQTVTLIEQYMEQERGNDRAPTRAVAQLPGGPAFESDESGCATGNGYLPVLFTRRYGTAR